MKAALTLGMDELLTNPRYAHVGAALRKLAPTSFTDQADAAVDHTDELRDALAGVLAPEKFRRGWAEAADYPDWLRLGVLDAFAGWITGETATCLHAPDPMRPQPLFAAAWKPGLVTCIRCTHLLVQPSRSRADKLCDGCGHECAGPDAGDGVYPGVVQLGVMLYEFGTCTSCHADMPVPVSD